MIKYIICSDIDNHDKVRIPAMGAPNNFMYVEFHITQKQMNDFFPFRNRVKRYIEKDKGRIAPDDCFGKISFEDRPSDANFEVNLLVC